MAKEVLTDLSPLLKLYTDGTVERLLNPPFAPPSPADPTTGVSSHDATISPLLSARIYLPKHHPTTKPPILLYFHGGGFCIGSAFSHPDHAYATLLSAATAALVVSVHYRLAPEHPIPAAYLDSWHALTWALRDQFIATHGDLRRVFVGGDSAGGNIARYLALRAGSEALPGDVKLTGAILSHPFFWGSEPMGKEPREDVEKSLPYRLWALASGEIDGGIDSPLINPLVDGDPGLPGFGSGFGFGCSKMIVFVGEDDWSTGRTKAYAEKVRESGWGGDVEVVEFEGENHCFHIFDTESENAKDLLMRWANFMKN